MGQHLRKRFPVFLFAVLMAMLLPAMCLRTEAADATVSDFAALKQAIADTPENGVIEITQGFSFDAAVVINKNLTLKAADNSSPVTLYPAPGKQHITMNGRNPHLRFENVILDGNNDLGGIVSVANPAIIENAVIQNCSKQAIHHKDGKLDIVGTTVIRHNSVYGIYSSTSKYRLTITGAQITGNGCGIRTTNGSAGLHVEDSFIAENHSDSLSGGVDATSHTTIVNSTIQNNSSSSTGGGIRVNNSPLVIEHSTISHNIASTSGGGVIVGGNTVIRDSIIMGNKGGNLGGGVCVSGSLLVERSTISENTAGNQGGGIYCNEVTIHDSAITGNKAKNGGGISGSIHTIKIRGESIVANNKADQAFHMTNTNDITTHNRNIDPTVIWTEGLDYAFNNLDVGYNKGTPVDPPNMHTITLTEQWTDGSQPDNTTTYCGAQGKPYTIPFTTPDGYTASAQVPEGVLVDYDAGTIAIPEVTSDIALILSYRPEPEGEMHNVTVITKYRDGARPDHTETYQVPHGTAFSEPFEILDGYDLHTVGLFSALEYGVDMDNKLVFINPVERDYTIVLEFYQLTHNVTVIVRYQDDVLEESVTTYPVPWGAAFDETFHILDGYRVASVMSSVPGVVVSAVDQTIHADAVNEPITVTIVIGKRA